MQITQDVQIPSPEIAKSATKFLRYNFRLQGILSSTFIDLFCGLLRREMAVEFTRQISVSVVKSLFPKQNKEHSQYKKQEK